MTTGGKIDPRSLLQLARRRKWFLIIPPIVALLGAYYNISNLPKVYRSETVIQIGNVAALSPQMGDFVDGSRERRPVQMRNLSEDILAQLVSVEVLGAVVDRVQLKPSQGMLETAKKLQLEHPDESRESIIRRLQIDWLAKRFTTDRVIFARRGSSMRISFDNSDPDKAYMIVKTLADVFIEQNLAKESRNAQIAIGFSKEHEERFRQQYEDALERLRRLKERSTYEQSKKLVVNANNEAQANTVLSALKVDIGRQQDLVSGLQTKLSSSAASAIVWDDPKAEALRRRMLQKAEALATVMAQFDWRDANVISVNQDIAALRDQYREAVAKHAAGRSAGMKSHEVELATQLQMAQLDLDLLQQEKKMLEGFLAEYRGSLGRQPGLEMDLVEAQKQVDDLAAKLYAFQNQTVRSKLGQDLQSSSANELFRIISPANRPLAPIPQNETQILLIAIFGGLGFGVGAVYLLEFFDHSFKSVDDVETLLGVTVLGVIPKIQFAEPGKAKRPF